MSTEFLEMLEKRVETLATAVPRTEIIENISDLADRQLQLERLQKKLGDLQDEISAQHKDISERILPQALASAGVSEFRLLDGSVVSVKRNYFPSIEDEHKQEAYQWMVDNGHDIIKNEIVVKLPKGKSEEAKEVASAVSALGFTPEQKESIHWQTFRAWAKEAIEKGVNVPESIKIHCVDKATIKLL